MANVYKGLTIKLGAETKDFTKAINSIKRESRDATRELKLIEKAMKFNPTSNELGTRQIQLLTRQVEGAKNELQLYKDKLDEAKRSNEQLTSEQWTKLASDIALAEANVEKYTKALSDALIKQQASQSLLGKMGNKLQSWGKSTTKIGQGMQTVGGAFTRTLTPAIIAAGTASIAAAVDIDTSLTNVKKTVDGTEQQYQQLKQAAIEFSKTNAVSATEILNIQSLGAQLGFAIDELDEFSRVVSGLDIATNMDAETAATELAHFANITKMSHEDISNYASAIVGLGNNFATTESDISSMAMRLAAAGTQVGMTQADILGLATALTSVGMEAEAGGTAISTIMSEIDKSVAKSDDNLKIWAETAGMTAQEFADAWNSNPVEALSALLSNMEAATAEGGNMALMLDELGITSLRQTDAMKRLAGNSDLVTRAVAKSNEEWSKNTALQNEVDNRNESLAAKFEMIKNRLIAIAEQVGGPLANAFLDIIDAAEPLIKAIEDGAKAFSEMSKEEQQTVLACAGLAAALGPVLSVFGGLLTKIEPLGKGMSTLAEWLAKIGGAGVDFSKSAESVGKAAEGAGKAAEGAAKGFGKFTTVLSGGLIAGTVTALLIALAAAIVGTVQGFQQAATNAENFSKATDGLHDAVSKIPGSYESAAGSVDKFGGAASDAAMSVHDLAASQAELTDSINERNDAANDDIKALERYQDTIEKFAGRSDLNAKQVSALEEAIKGVNAVAGTSWELAQDEAGAYQVIADGATVAKDAVKELIDTMKIQREASAVADNLADAEKAQTEAIKTKQQAAKDYQAALEHQKEVEGQNIEIVQQAAEAVRDTGNSYRAAAKMADEASRYYKACEDNLAILTIAQQENATAAQRMVAESGVMRSVLLDSGQSAVEFADALSITGANIADIERLGPKAMGKLAESYDGSIQSIVKGLGGLNVAFDETKVQSIQAMDAMLRDADLLQESVQQSFSNAGLSTTEFVSAMVDAGISVQDFRNLSAEQLSQVVELYGTSKDQALAKMQEFVDANREKGAEAGQAWYSGFSESTMQAAQAAAETAGLTLQQFLDTVPEYYQASEQALMEYISGLQSGDGSGGQQAAQTEADGAANATGWTEAGQAGVDQFNQPLFNATGEGGQHLGQVNAEAAKGFDGEYQASADSSKEVYQSTLASADGSGGQTMGSTNAQSAAGTQGEYSSAGDGNKEAYDSALSSDDGHAGEQLASINLENITSKTGEFQTAGSDHGTAYADGIDSTQSQATAAGNNLVDSANSALSSGTDTAYSSGSHLGEQFAAGIRSQVSAVSSAAKALADAAASYIKHTKPDKGPLSRGEEIFGKHLAQNFAKGILGGRSVVASASSELAQQVKDYLGHSQPAKGPLSGGEWIYGFHTATNYADGLYSAKSKVDGAASEIASSVVSRLEDNEPSAEELMDAYFDSIIEAYQGRTGELRQVSTRIGEIVWNSLSPAIMSKGWERAAYAEIDRFEQLSELRSKAVDSINDSQEWVNAYQALSKRLGTVHFSKTFIEAAKGSDDFKVALQQLSTVSDTAAQAIVNAYDDMVRAERLQEIEARSLWVNSMKYVERGVSTSIDWLLDYRETCLDVKEALYSDKGLNRAFNMAGVSVEEFAFSLQSVDMTMDDFKQSMGKFVDDVTNGFSTMTKYNQTTLEEWTRNLKINMAESQAYAENVTKVMNSIPANIDSDAFRQAVLEGGFSKWGQVMADLAGKNADEVVAAIQLYNKAVMEAQQSSIEQMVAIAPGDELMDATIKAVLGKTPELSSTMMEVSEAANAAMLSTRGEWTDTGANLADGIAVGIESQISKVASSAASLVSAAVSAAKAEADINSPSKRMRDEIGKMMGEGMGLGLSDEANYITKQAQRLAALPLSTLKGSQTVSNSVVNKTQNNVSQVWNVTVRNDHDLRTLMRDQNRETNRIMRGEGMA